MKRQPCQFASLDNCSNDRLEIWHGRPDPTILCGYHEQSFGVNAHRPLGRYFVGLAAAALVSP